LCIELYEIVVSFLSYRYFPHLFNTVENQEAVLDHLPDKELYMCDGMSVDGRAAFDTWYEEHQQDSFNFREEIVKYCISDVDILMESCLKFRALFKEISATPENPEGLDPLVEATTIASACSILIRSNYLEEKTIGIIPQKGYSNHNMQSCKAKRWLSWIAHSRKIDIAHSRNGSEKIIDGYRLDGYRVAEDGQEYCYEFNGCFW